MEYLLDSEMLQFIWSALRETTSPPNLKATERQLKSIIEKGWAFKADVEDLFYIVDSRLGFQIDVVKFSKIFGIHWELVCFRPQAKSNYVSEYSAIRAEDAAVLLIILERMGFQVDPRVFIDQLLLGIKARTKKVLSNAELEIFWYNKTRHRYGKLTLAIGGKSETDKIIDSFKTIGKYGIVVKGTHGYMPESIEILSPKFRHRREPMPVTCQHCGLMWYKGDPDSSASHRREHKRRMYYLDPRPSIEMIRERVNVHDPELVRTNSPAWKHREIYLRARAFKREFGYDFVQWQSEKGDNDPYVHGFLFTNDLGVIVGACSFRRREKENSQPYWALDWVWVCPKERRKGHLAFRWKTLRERFGNFRLTFPVSDDMKTFLAKHGDSALIEG